ncbi:MAG: lipase family alpha/beta hydrolase, partial [Alcanivoracaceae bacterium]
MNSQHPTTFTPDARFLLGLSQLTLSLAGELTETIGDMHGEIRRSTPLGLLPESTSIARRVYGLLGKGFEVPGQLLSRVGQRVAPREVDTTTLNVQAAINGVFGDLLVRQDNPLAFSPSLYGDTPRRDQPLVLFAHGLCLHERGWQRPVHLAFANELRKQGYAVGYLRYNSGLPIAENARVYADLLEQIEASQILLVGHSMGGLISRSALRQAREAGMRFPERVTHLATLGSPHHGADAERIGNYSNRLLTVSRWSAPLTRLGNLRSAAIHDLRFGSLLHSDRERAGDLLHTHDPREHIPAPEDVAHYYLGATRSPDNSSRKLRSDLLVMPHSALAEDYPGTEAVTRELLYGLD